jgi:uncharacterized membrane protein YdjX (TVP38/TMEM64 family)
MMVAETEDGRRTRPLMRLTGLVAVIAAVAIVGHASGAAAVTAAELREWVQGFSRLAPLIFIALFVALNTLGLPAPVLGAVGGATFGLFEGAAVTLSAMWVTACIQFLLARRLGGERLRKRLGDQLGRIGLLLERRGALAVAGGRLLPGPFSELNMAAALTPLTFRDFAVGTLLGCAPKAAAWSAVGAALG